MCQGSDSDNVANLIEHDVLTEERVRTVRNAYPQVA
jgi:hypothetical protein